MEEKNKYWEREEKRRCQVCGGKGKMEHLMEHVRWEREGKIGELMNDGGRKGVVE